jgi:5-methylcytosine-specific restriction endonuclease McrA
MTRSTTNGNVRGSAQTRIRRRIWLVETYRANVDLVRTPIGTIYGVASVGTSAEEWAPGCTQVPACHCYRCGVLLSVDTVTVDRIIPGIKGGTYRRNNIRPACLGCNSSTGGRLGASRVCRG